MDRLTRPRLPALDAADRRVVSIALVLVCLFLVLCATVGAGMGLGVLAYRLLSGGG